MAAHQADLRAEVEKQAKQRDDAATGDEQDIGIADGKAFAADIAAQGSEAAPTQRLRALLQFAERLSLQPGSVEEQHLDALREVGYDDRAISDAVQVVSYFNYINRIADGLGVDLEHDMA